MRLSAARAGGYARAMRMLARYLAPAIVASIVSSASASRAELVVTPQPSGPIPAGYVPVMVHGDAPGLHYQLLPDRRDAEPIAECPAECTIYVPRGRYRLRVAETDDTRAGTRTIEVEGPTAAYVEPRTKSARDVGLTLGVLGSVLVIVGAIGIIASVDRPGHHDSLDAGGDVALLAFIGGAIMCPIGWVNFGRSSPSVETSPLVEAPTPTRLPPAPSVALAIAPWGGLSPSWGDARESRRRGLAEPTGALFGVRVTF